ncbi:MAG: GIY-YIG nuclease family protein, partial [Patescibacteria group bacterium]
MPSNKISPMFFYTYVLQSLKDNNNYIGYTKDLVKRVKEHKLGLNFSTSWRRPFKLIYYEACLNEQDAKHREIYLKNTAGRRFLAKQLRLFKLTGLAK